MISLPNLSSVANRFSKSAYLALIREVKALPEVKKNDDFISFLDVAYCGAMSVGIKKSDVVQWLAEDSRAAHDNPSYPKSYHALVAFRRAFYTACIN